MARIIAALFRTYDEASEAVRQLESAGFAYRDISIADTDSLPWAAFEYDHHLGGYRTGFMEDQVRGRRTGERAR